MFSTVRYFIKTSIIFLMVGILTGLYMVAARSYSNEWPHPDLVSAHTHIILVGSVMMMIMGVALWFFPRAEKNDKLYKPANNFFVCTIWYVFKILAYAFFIIPGNRHYFIFHFDVGKNKIRRQPSSGSQRRKILGSEYAVFNYR
jgi:heme/copper-type cytochrome/quinol oxidase subunit 1